MDVISMHQAKSSLSQLVARAEQGETILIGAYGKAQAKIVPTNFESKPKKKIGILAGKLHIPEDFDEPLEDDVLAEFEGK
ncbi:type II toxin-antitoxin system Phd/YefM family antitoxin [Endozoicomonas sp. SM1973]|uniref:Type II toxin-antitoxin system Phd/YefM family antitoxin n=1 Tax=Spartinivicinus marinus TaxID=2994442 RepID=A0A853IK50_9GAMM|nr:type II toxin-antitoxin system Phd/YefM family antitoxin [Spartinivicinus marinus]MCX4027249.1 type II toxin-antitoxin system Phd/YefM family antitoxin [Spartinivicinus marinus]NYZ69757.1 type II toxin-antitoxin system Phd/YefM family antitoxin [Spartinivicinus marinus]